MPIIKLTGDINYSCVDRLRELMLYFGAHTKGELLQYFPVEDEGLIDYSLKILTHKHEIKEKEYINDTFLYFSPRKADDFQVQWDARKKYLPASDFIRWIINSTDEQGYLINDVPFIGVGKFPCVMYFFSNRKLFELYSIPLEDVEFLTKTIQMKDYSDDYEADPNNPRIVLIDSASYLDQIKIKNVAYFAIYDKKTRTFTMKRGD